MLRNLFHELVRYHVAYTHFEASPLHNFFRVYAEWPFPVLRSPLLCGKGGPVVPIPFRRLTETVAAEPITENVTGIFF